MWFYKKVDTKGVATQGGSGTYVLDKTNAIIGIVLVALLLVAALVAYSMGWTAGANDLMTAIVGAIGLFVGALFGESHAAG